ncbi:RNA-binding protein 45-like [Bolinopsis microptera]|uniref:RNA-binding protein 45-like n=1 Tax=Bolinopsis microptera TaxID=2820187 RepID=UPI003079C03E
MSSEERKTKVDHDNPPFSRLFVVCSKNHTDDDIKEAFGSYGKLQDVWVVTDRNTQERKGIAYIKFEKASEAHIAMEKLHGETIGGDSKPLKVLLADNKGQSRSVSGEAKPRSRIFILVPKTMSSSEVEEEFTKFGSVDHVQILTDRSSGESKGCAYVKFVKPSSAFSALEDCDEKYRAVIAEPRVPRDARTGGFSSDNSRDNSSSRHLDHSRRSTYSSAPYVAPADHQNQTQPETISFTDLTDPGAMQRLYIVCHTSLYEEQLYSLFDLIPGLESFELKHYRGSTESRGFAYAGYRTIELACYAKRKLDGLEYPPGHKLIVKYAEDRPAGAGGNRERQGSSGMRMDTDAWNSANAVQRNVSMMAPRYSAPPTMPAQQVPTNRGNECPYTDTSLPNPLPMAAPGTACRAKLFLVATPTIPDEIALKDVFCRFASLIEIKLIPGTSYGYIRYGMKESAEAACMVLNNGKIQGNEIKLSQQEEGGDNKRARNSFDGAAAQW